jgi:hypothetical protein
MQALNASAYAALDGYLERVWLASISPPSDQASLQVGGCLDVMTQLAIRQAKALAAKYVSDTANISRLRTLSFNNHLIQIYLSPP